MLIHYLQSVRSSRPAFCLPVRACLHLVRTLC